MKKTTLEIKITELKAQIPILEAELAECNKEQAKVDNFYETLLKAERFAYEHWKKKGEEAENKLIKNIKNNENYYRFSDVEWIFKYSRNSYDSMNNALENFKKIVEDYNEKSSEAIIKLANAQHELKETERRLLRKKLQKQGKEFLKCEYNSRNVLGCFGDYKCKSCISNYYPGETTEVTTN